MGDEPDIAAGLLAALERDGELVDEGGFDIDIARGLDKLARFALAEPSSFVLRLLEAGLCAGADAIEVELGKRALELRWIRADPIVLPSAALDRLVTVLVGRSPELGGVARELLVLLAIGALGALQASAAEVVIDSVGCDGAGRRLRVTRAAGQRSEAITGGAPGTRVRVLGLGERSRVRELLERCCAWAATPISLDGELISGKPIATGRELASVPVENNGQRIGRAAKHANGRWGEIRVLAHGLLIESFALHDRGRGVFVNLDLSLPRDLSRTKLVRGEALDEALAAAERACDRLPGSRLPDKVARPHAPVPSSTPLPAYLIGFASFVACLLLGAAFGSITVGYVLWMLMALGYVAVSKSQESR